MANTPEVNYSKSTTTLKSPPAAGENINLFLRPGDELSLGVDLSKASLQIVGGDVIATLPNGGQITFVSLGMMAFESNAPIVKLPSGMVLQIEQILNKVQDIGQAPRDSILVSGPVSLQSEQHNPAKEEHSNKDESPVNDYNAYYVDPQPFIKPQENANTKESSGKYLQEAVTQYTSNNPSISDSTEKNKHMDEQSKSKDNVADVSAALSFDLGFYQIKSSDTTDATAHITTVLGGTGSALGNVSKSAAAQFQPETLDYRNDAYPTVITADNPSLVNSTYLTKLVRLSVSQPIGFAIENIDITGLSNGFQILNANFTSANATSGGWSLASGTGFTSTPTDGGEIIEFYIRYEPTSANMTLNFDYLMKVNLTSQFDMSHIPVSQQAGVVVPDKTTLTNFKDIGVIVKDVNTESDYTYTGRYPAGFVVDTTPNENIIYTSKFDSTVYGGLSNDTIYGNIGNDTLNGNKGNDTLSGGSGTNIINGDDGIDTVSYDFVVKNYSDTFLSTHSGLSNDPHPKGVIVNLQTGFASGQTIYDSMPRDEYNGEAFATISDTLTNVENVIGSKFDDTITGSNTIANMLHGGEGNDTIDGGSSGGNYLYGEAGNDWLIGSTRDAKIDGGDGTDTVDFSNNAVGIEITLNNSSNGSIKDIGASAATTVILNVENIAGTQYKDIIAGDNSNNLLIGGYDHLASIVTANDDTISGGAGADTIVGDLMIDSVVAGNIYAGSDVLKGGSENDTIYGDSSPILSTSVLSVSADQSVEYIIDTNPTTHVATTLATIHGGNDTLQGGAGDDYLDGGSGFDTVDFSNSTSKVYVNLSLNTAIGDGTDVVKNIENIIGSNATLGDTLIGNGLVNTISGSSGGDTLSGLDGNDTLDGKTGSDWVDYSYASSVTVNLVSGTGIVSGSDSDTLISIENVIGSSGADILSGIQGTVNTLLGKDGNDLFYGSFDGDTLDGGNGIDTVDYANASGIINVTLGGSNNSDKLISIENVYGATGNDTLVGDSNDNVLDGRSGNDTLIGGSGSDTLIGGSGIDTADYSSSTNAINVNLTTGSLSDGFGGIDTLSGIEIVKGSLFNDAMTGSNLSDTLIGNSGNDTFFASNGNDTYWGNTQASYTDSNSDKIDYSSSGTFGVDHMVAHLSTASVAGSITTYSGANALISTDTVYSVEDIVGTSGNDTIIGGSGVINTLFGGAGNDVLSGNIDGDLLDGGTGINLADYSSSTQNLIVDLSASLKNVYVLGSTPTSINADTLSNIQQISSGAGNDKFIGNSADNIFMGGVGNDTFIGGAGNDTFIGGTDTTHDSGMDTADYSSSITSIDADLTRLSAQVIGNAVTDGTDTLYGIENIIGTAQADTLVGDANANILTGGAGDDTLKGNGGADQLYGGLGNDTIFGGLDGDSIDGGAISERNTVDYSTFASASTINLTTGKAYQNGTPTLFDALTNIQNVVGTTASDTIIGKSGVANTLVGGAGDDTLSGNLDGDLLDGGVHTIGDTADYSAYTASTNLTVDMGAQTIAQSSNVANKDSFQNIEVIKTGAGTDTFTVNTAFDAGNYTLDGGSGEDTIDYGAISESINVTLNGATNTTVIVGAVSGNDDVIANIEDVKGSKVDDTITGDALANKLYGNEGNDTLDGGAGSDILYGGDGSDVIVGTQDGVSDLYYGGNASGTDTGTMDRIDYSAVVSNITLTSGTTVSNSTVGADVLSGIEIFDSGSGSDTLSGGSAGITIYGNLGSDKITGGTGNDVLYGDTIGNIHADSQNMLVGGAGNDTLYAGSAGDSLRGDAGNDTMFGGAGVDTLDYVTNNIAITALLNTGVINGDGSDVIDTTTIEILRSGTGADNITGADTGVLATIYTGTGNDTINGGTLAETLYGEVGNDTLRGGGGIDTIFGGSGNDFIYGSIDGDKVYGDNGSGNVGGTSDTLDFSDVSSALVIDMVAGTVNSTASTFSEIENITGGSGNDTIYGDANANILKGGAGNDTIFTSQGIDTLDGGSENDTVDFSAITTASINVNLSTLQVLNDGYGNVESIQNIENINGGNYTAGDTLYGDGSDNIIFGNLGSDQLSGNDGNDILYGDNVGNTHTTSDGHNTIDGGAGNDTLYAGGSGDTLIGGSGADKLYGAAGDDTLSGGLGDDTLDGGAGIDIADYRSATAKVVITSVSANVNDTTDLTTGTLSGTEGTDIITNTVEVIYGSSGYDDTLSGNANANTFYGWGGNDTIDGGRGNDTIYGGSGDDTIAGNEGNDFLVGGDSVGVLAGWDSVDYSSDAAGVTVNLTTGTATDGSGGTDTLSGFSRVLGSNYADTLTGNIGADDLRGNGGDDWFVMSAGNDTIYGGTTLQTNGDTVDFINASTAGVLVNLATNNASGTDIGTDVIYEVENVSGTNFADTITGDTNANILVGRALNDTILAGAGNDILYGDDNSGLAVDGSQTGNDFLYGQDGNDTIYAGLGNDSLWGGNNNDTLYGGSGDDYLNGESGINVLDGGAGNDNFELADATATNTITGGLGTDTVSFYYAGSAVTANLGTLSSNQATGGAGTVNFTDTIENVSGSGYNDVITGNALANIISGNNGNDTLYGAGGIDTIYGGAGNDKLYSDSAAPTLSDGGNSLYGGDGNDTLYGGLGNDSLYGENNDDTIIAISSNDGSDVIDGGSGTDTVDYTAVNNAISVTLADATIATVTVVGGNNDTIVNVENFIGGSGNDTITGSAGNNSLNGSAGDDTLIGGSGNDILTDALGTNVFAGGAGDDTITGTGATSSWLDYSLDGITEGAVTSLNTTINQVISTNRGNDIIIGVNNITGSAYNDIFYGNASVNTINGGSGNDSIEGYGGSDVLDGGSGIDTVSYFNENQILVTLNDSGTSTVGVWNGANYTTEVDTISNFENISGSNSGADIISGNASNNTIRGNVGNDSLYGGGGNDYIDGGSDNDTISGGTGTDTIYGGFGNDVLRGGGSSYNSTNTADGAVDTLYGNDGDDTIYGMLDGDALYGGDASSDTSTSDILRYDELSGKNIYVNLSTNEAYEIGSSSVKDTIGGFESVIAGNGNDSLVGNAANNTLIGNGGNDTLERGTTGGVDILYGDDIAGSLSGNDTFLMSKSDLTSNLTIFGGLGIDSLQLKDTITSSDVPVFTNVFGVEKVQLFTGDNTVTIDLNDTTLLGNSGNDTFKYTASNFDSHDTIDGGSGTDTLLFTTAGTLTEAMFNNITSIEKIQLADGGNTITLDASAKGATLLGGTGADIFKYAIGDLTSIDTIMGGNGNDTISFLDTGTIVASNLANISGVEYIQLFAGTNTLDVGTGYTILGSSSDDILIGGTGVNNTINAGSGNDTFKFAFSDFTVGDIIDGGAGTNTLEFTDSGVISSIAGSYSNIQKIQFASTGANTITLDKDGITLLGGSDNDTFNYAIANLSSADIIVGGAGTDTLSFSTNGVIDATSMFNNVSGIEVIQLSSAGANTVTNFSKTGVSLVGGSGVDNITGTSAANTIYGGSGNDVINGGGGADLLYGDDGDDTFNLSIANLAALSTLVGGNGTDTLVMSDTGSITSTKIDSSIEFLQLASGTNTINVANVSILGTSGADSIIGGTGNNTIYAGSGADTVEFALGNLSASDTIDGGSDASTDVFKVTGSGTLSGALFQNVTGFETLNLSGFSGTATLDSSAINKFSTIDASTASGNIALNISAYTSSVNVTLGSGADNISITSTQTASLTGGSGVDTATITDVIASGGISATLSGIEIVQLANGANNATLDYNGMTILGGSGNDTLNYTTATFSATDTIDGSTGTDVLHFTTGGTITGLGSNISHIETIHFSDAGNTLTLASGGYDILAGSGNDNVTISSASAIHSFDGVSGTDSLTVTSTMDLSSVTLSNLDTLNVNSSVALTMNASQLAQFSTIAGSGSLVTTADASLDMSTVSMSSLTGVTYNDTIGGHTLAGSNSSIAETYNLSAASSIDGNGGTDTVNLLASMDLSNKLQDIEALNVNNYNTTITSSDDNSFALSGTGNLSIDATGTYSAAGITGKGVTINGSAGNDTITATNNDDTIMGNGGVDTIDAGSGNDKFVLDFSNLASLDSFNGNSGSDTVSLTGSNASLLDNSKFSNIETLDISSLGLSGSGLSISATALDSFTTSHALTLDISDNTQGSHINLTSFGTATDTNTSDSSSVAYSGSGLSIGHDYTFDNGLILHVV